MDELLTSSIHFHDNAKRNIVYVSKPEEAFASLLEDEKDAGILQALMLNARTHVSRKASVDDFYFTSAIEYPFKTEPFMSSRYSNGSYPIWYGSLEIETTVYETVHHSLKFLKATEGAMNESEIIRKRSIFDVQCSAILINLSGLENKYPDIISDDYSVTQTIGSTVRASGMAGIMSPSARHKKGTNLNIFIPDVLDKPDRLGVLTYRILPKENCVQVYGNNIKMSIPFE